MKFTLSWLKEHLETKSSLDEISDVLTMIGLEVEDIIDPAKGLSAFIVVEVVEAKQHPNADRLQVCKVNTRSETIQIVCGAPNARAGMKAVFAPSGTTIPGSGVVLKPTKIRDVESNGMICSEREMGLSDEHEGIIELPQDAAIGTPFADILGLNDPVIEIAITPNRPDCLGVRGVARDLAAAGLGTLKEDPIQNIKGKFKAPLTPALEFEKDKVSACLAFAGRTIRDVKNGSSPDWLQQRLKAIGLRPINALVDMTNYITYDRGRPLHVYDADKLSGTIHARLGKKGEEFLALDGKTYQADDTMCVIADDSGILGLGGIIGGDSSSCSEETTNVFIESALFDTLRTAATGRKLNIESDARYRFERGIDPEFTVPGLEYATDMVLQLCGGEPGEIALAGDVSAQPAKFTFDSAQVKRIGGLDVSAAQAADILKKLGFKVEAKGNSLEIEAPSWRPDIHESADLVEEIVRIIGVDQVPSTPMKRTDGVPKPILTETQNRMGRVKRTLALRGMAEAMIWSFIPRAHAQAFGGGSDELELANPISTEMSSMRPSLLAGLLSAAARNLDRGAANIALFEAGQVYRGRKPEDQFMTASGIRLGRARFAGSGRHWAGGDKTDIFEVKADALDVLSELGVPIDKTQISTDAPSWFHPGRSGVVRLGPKNELAHFGELHPAILEIFNISDAVYGFEIFIDNVPASKARATKSKPPLKASDLQTVRRDFAFVVEKHVAAQDLLKAAASADRELISAVRLFDVFEGGSLGLDKKSLGIEVTIQPFEKTLTDKEIDAIADKIIANVQKNTGAVLRG